MWKPANGLWRSGCRAFSQCTRACCTSCRHSRSQIPKSASSFRVLACCRARSRSTRRVACISRIFPATPTCATAESVGKGECRAAPPRPASFPCSKLYCRQKTINNVKRVLGTLCEAWANEQKQAPPLTDLVQQVHKDYADAIERARAEIFPQSRE